MTPGCYVDRPGDGSSEALSVDKTQDYNGISPEGDTIHSECTSARSTTRTLHEPFGNPESGSGGVQVIRGRKIRGVNAACSQVSTMH